MSIEVILLENIYRLGKVGEIKKVKSGYARNYLLPEGKAERATEDRIAALKEKLGALKEKADILQKQAEKLATQLSQIDLTLTVKAGDSGKLFGSVARDDIMHALEKHDITLRRQQIIMPEGRAIRLVGTYPLTINLDGGVQAKLDVTISPITESNDEQ